MKQYKFQRWLVLLTLLAGMASAQSVSFGLIGDMPYSDWAVSYTHLTLPTIYSV